jgi:hypothetical protein
LSVSRAAFLKTGSSFVEMLSASALHACAISQARVDKIGKRVLEPTRPEAMKLAPSRAATARNVHPDSSAPQHRPDDFADASLSLGWKSTAIPGVRERLCGRVPSALGAVGSDESSAQPRFVGKYEIRERTFEIVVLFISQLAGVEHRGPSARSSPHPVRPTSGAKRRQTILVPGARVHHGLGEV